MRHPLQELQERQDEAIERHFALNGFKRRIFGSLLGCVLFAGVGAFVLQLLGPWDIGVMAMIAQEQPVGEAAGLLIVSLLFGLDALRGMMGLRRFKRV